jgi:hypothetical protein
MCHVCLYADPPTLLNYLLFLNIFKILKFNFLFLCRLFKTGDPTESNEVIQTPTKEYSRIRQLSGNQYQSQYGVVQDVTADSSVGHRPQPSPAVVRPLFA